MCKLPSSFLKISTAKFYTQPYLWVVVEETSLSNIYIPPQNSSVLYFSTLFQLRIYCYHYTTTALLPFIPGSQEIFWLNHSLVITAVRGSWVQISSRDILCKWYIFARLVVGAFFLTLPTPKCEIISRWKHFPIKSINQSTIYFFSKCAQKTNQWIKICLQCPDQPRNWPKKKCKAQNNFCNEPFYADTDVC